MDEQRPTLPFLLKGKDHAQASVFRPENMLREARRQKGLPDRPVPAVCILDPDGDLVRRLCAQGAARPCTGWACYHTDLLEFEHGGLQFGILGRAVGAAFAVLVAEELFACGCRLLISVTSAGQITASGPTPYVVVIDRSLRDEGTSYHYLPPADFAHAEPALVELALAACKAAGSIVHRGATWTTDAPFRETMTAIEAARALGVLAVEMEAAALYAFAEACGRSVLCLAHVTNVMAQIEGDFEKGEADGVREVLDLVAMIAGAWHER